MKKLLFLVPFMAVTSMIYSVDNTRITVMTASLPTESRPSFLPGPTLEYEVSLDETLGDLANRISQDRAFRDHPQVGDLVVGAFAFGKDARGVSRKYSSEEFELTLRDIGVRSRSTISALLLEGEEAGQYIKG